MTYYSFKKILFTSSISLIIFGLLVRVFNIYFFWESLYIGVEILLLFLFLFIRIHIQKRKTIGKKALPLRFVSIIIVFIFITQLVVTITLVNIDAYPVARSYIKNNKNVYNKTGRVYSITIIPFGGFELKKDKTGEYGNANINFLVKGEKGYLDYLMNLEKDPKNAKWGVIATEEISIR